MLYSKLAPLATGTAKKMKKKKKKVKRTMGRKYKRSAVCAPESTHARKQWHFMASREKGFQIRGYVVNSRTH